MGTNTSSQTLVGVDLGGTTVRAGVLDASQAQMLTTRQAPIQASQGPEAGLDRIISLIEQTLVESGHSQIDGLGIGCTGPLDPRRGLIQNPYTLPGWDNFDICTPLRQHFDTKVVLENDADTAALGEYWQGAGQGVRRLYAVTVGTGIGTAFILDGAIYRGLDGFHPEGGHLAIDPNGPLCYCGSHGCWESLASGPAIARMAQERLQQAPDSLMIELAGGDVANLETRLVAEAAQRGDILAKEIMEKAAEYFSLGLMNVIALFVPEMIVLSGGVMKSSSFFMPAIQKALEVHGHMIPSRQVRVLPARLGYLAGVYGAAYAALQGGKA